MASVGKFPRLRALLRGNLIDVKLSAPAKAALIQAGVSTLYLFGSRAQGISHGKSDYDFGVLLKDPSRLSGGSQELYQEIYDILQDEVEARVNLDIVFLGQAPLQLRYHVLRYGKVLLDEEPLGRGRFAERTLEEHADFEPYRRLFEEATLAKIS